MPTVIDSLSIEIESNSASAASGIDALAESLGKLKKNGSVGVAVKNLKELSSALKSMTTASSNANKISSLADAMEKLKTVGSTGAGVKKMAESLASLKEATKGLDDESIAAFASRVELVSRALTPLSSKMTTIQAGFNAINTKARKAGDGVKKFSNRLNASSINMSSFIYTLQSAVNWIQKVVNKFAEFIGDAAEWDGISARFGRGFGPQAQETYEWIQKLNQEMGINTQQFMQYSSTYATMLKGFGVSQEDASKMALGYMEMTYDIWAGYNDQYKSLEDAAEAVRSAIAGEVEPVRKIGSTIIESVLEQTAANNGLEISLENATEAQKSYLRYQTMVDQAHAQNLVGTYAAEMNTAEGVMRTLNQQVKSLSQSFASLFLPILVEIVPYMQAVVDLAKEAVYWLANLMNVEIQAVDFSGYKAGVDGAKEALDSATKSAKELKNATLGIDELNVISPQSGDGGGSGAGFDGLDVNSLWDESIFENIQSQVDQLKKKLKPVLDLVLKIGGALLALKIADGVSNSIEDFADWLEKLDKSSEKFSAGRSLVIGATLMITGAVLMWDAIKGTIADGMDWGELAQMIIASATFIGGATLVGRAFGKEMFAGLASTATMGAAIFVTAFIDAIKNGLSTKNGLAMILGGGMAGGAIGGPIGALIGVAVAGMAVLGVEIAKKWDQIKLEAKSDWDAMVYQWNDTVRVFGEAWALGKQKLSETFGPFWEQLKLEAKSDWDATVTYWSDFFADIESGWSDFKTSFSDGWNLFWNDAGETVDGMINGVISAVESGLNWCINALNSMSWTVPDWVPNIGGKTFGFDIPLVTLGRVDFFANGGFPEVGQMFLAREGGPELVGSINGRTAVANNDQIVAAVSEGVYNAVVAAMSSASAGSGQSVNVYLDGKQIYASVKKTESERGMGLMGNQLGYVY